MTDFVDPTLNAVITGIDAADTGLQVGNVFTSLINGVNIVISKFLQYAELIIDFFIAAGTAFLQIVTPIFWAGLYFFIFSVFTAVIIGAETWNKGLGSHLACAGEQYKQGWENQGRVLNVLAPCSWEKFLHFLDGSCTRYYIVDMIKGLIYGIFIELPLVLIKAILGIDLTIFVDMLENLVIIPIDTLSFMLSGYHLVRWSDSVINKCYRCKGKYKLSNGKEITLYKTFDQGAKLFKCGHEQIVEGGMRIFTSLLPSEKWWEWSQGRHLYPPDWGPKAWGGAWGY